jgi:hypothetical protein
MEVTATKQAHVESVAVFIEEFCTPEHMIDVDFEQQFADSPRPADCRRLPIRRVEPVPRQPSAESLDVEVGVGRTDY